ncbi:MAG TPA: serine protease, partial [Ruminococcaceae bacterium]|nr:serine protease [Oscillospiraceae bacterium]
GENIAYGYRTPAEVVEGWLNSPGHRANILTGSFTHIGVGYNENGNYWVQLFITEL